MDKKIKEEKVVDIIRNFEFEKICRLKQMDLKLYVFSKLVELGYEVISDDGFLYAKGTEPVMLLAHMDTVHKVPVKTIQYFKDSSRILSPEGIGGDDRCGIYMILEILKEHKCSVLFTEDEEIGCVGAKKFAKTDYINSLDVNYMIEFDRRGKNDAVFYSCDNKDFTKFITSGTGLIKSHGSCSDISTIAPASKIAAVNLSCGYYQAHTVTEYVVFEEMYNIIKIAKEIIQKECTKPFEYIEEVKSYSTYNSRSNYYDDYYGSYTKSTKYGEKLYRKNNQKSFVIEFLLYLGDSTDGSVNSENIEETNQEYNQETLTLEKEDGIEETNNNPDGVVEEVLDDNDDIVTVYTIIEALTEDEAVGLFFKRFQQHCYSDIVRIYIGSKATDETMFFIDSIIKEEKPPITFVVGDLITYTSPESYNQYLYTNGVITKIDEEKREATCAFGISGSIIKICDIDDLEIRQKPLEVGDLVKVIDSDAITSSAVIEGDVLEVKAVYASGVSLNVCGTNITTYCQNGGVELLLSKSEKLKGASGNPYYLAGDRVDCKIATQKKDVFETVRGTIKTIYEYGAEVDLDTGKKEFLLYPSIELCLFETEKSAIC